MKRFMVFAFGLLLSAAIFAQQDKYQAALEKAVGELRAAEQTRDFSGPANTFERIAAAAPEGAWLPAYYQAYAHVMQAVGALQQGQSDQITAYLEKAQKALDKAKAAAPGHPEVLALQGYIYTGHIWADPQGNGPIYSPQSVGAYQKAIEAGPDYPRAYHLMGMHLFYMPPMYGGGPKKALSFLQQAAERFEAYEPASGLHPTWGQYFNQQLIEQATAQLEKSDK